MVVLFSDSWKRLICGIIKIVIMILVSRVVRSSHSEQGFTSEELLVKTRLPEV